MVPGLEARDPPERPVILDWLAGFGQNGLGNCPLVSLLTSIYNVVKK